MSKYKILIGADPELFVKNPNSGAFVSAHGMVPGTKQKPHKVPLGAVQIDGTALEFNIDPASTADEFVRNINSVRDTLTAMTPGFQIVTTPVARFERQYFEQDVPESAKELGCEPDYNGWTLDQNPRPDPGDEPFRTASGHVHIGWTSGQDQFNPEHFEKCAAMARQMDYYLGVHSLKWDADPTRRKLYGMAGAFRPKPYGMEYRVLSNRWLSSSLLVRWVYNSAVCGTEAFLNGTNLTDTYGALAKDVIDNNELHWENYMDLEGHGIPRLPEGLVEKVAA